MSKIIIAGSSRTGKSVLANELKRKLGIKLISTDSYINSFSWSDTPEAIINDIKDLDSYILEGIQCGRVIRTAEKLGIDLGYDTVYCLFSEWSELNKGQLTQKKGCQTIWKDCVPILNAAGIDCIYEIPEKSLKAIDSW